VQLNDTFLGLGARTVVSSICHWMWIAQQYIHYAGKSANENACIFIDVSVI